MYATGIERGMQGTGYAMIPGARCVAWPLSLMYGIIASIPAINAANQIFLCQNSVSRA